MPDLLQNLFLLVKLPAGRNQPRDGSPHHLTGGVTENLFRPQIPTGDDAVRIFANDRVVREFNNRRQPAQGDFRALALGDVADVALDDGAAVLLV